MTRASLNGWKIRKKTKDVVLSYEMKQKGKYIKGSIIAIVLGLILAGIVIAIQNVNPFQYLKYLFDISFNDLYRDQTIQWLCVYIIAALAVAIGFKSGLFNIGVSGQMLLGAGMSIIFYKVAIENKGIQVNAGHIIIMFLICVFAGAFLSGIAGALRALFNIHEVVTTIMLNWSVWYLLKYLFVKYASTIGGPGISTSAAIPGGQLDINGSSIVVPIIIALLCLALIAVLLSKTVFGYKLKAVGSSTSASKYAGFNVKTKIVQAMLISGAFAGIASFINIMTLTPNITFTVDNLPSIGYDSIAISLVAFNNPIGIFFTSLLWGILQSGGSSAASLFNLPNQMSSLVFGIIVYFAAISVVFMNYYPILKLKYFVAVQNSKSQSLAISELRKKQNKYRAQLINLVKTDEVENYREFINEEKINLYNKYLDLPQTKENKKLNKKEVHKLNKQFNLFVDDYKKGLKEKISQINIEIKNIKKDTYVNRINSAKKGIEHRAFISTKKVENYALKDLSFIKSDYLQFRDDSKKELKLKNNWYKIQKRELKNQINSKKIANDVWLEGSMGEATQYYSMFNGRVEIKGEIKKAKLKANNKISSLRSDYRMNRLSILNNRVKDKTLKELKIEFKNEVKLIEQKFKTYKKEQLAKIKELEKQHKNTKKRLAKETTVIKDLNTAYSVRNQELNNEFKINLKLLKQESYELRKLINKEKSKNEYSIAKQFIKEFRKKSSDSKYEVGVEKQYYKLKFAVDDLKNSINLLWKEKYSDYDSKYYSVKRFKIYNFINKQEKFVKEQEVVLKANKKIEVIDKNKRIVLEKYKDNLEHFKEEFRNQKINITKNKNLDGKTKQHLISIEHDKNDVEIEKFINMLETSLKEREVA